VGCKLQPEDMASCAGDGFAAQEDRYDPGFRANVILSSILCKL
jgi:hypothetical protein